MNDVRVRAARVLVAVERRRRTLAAEVDAARRDLPDERDRGLLLELTAGVFRWRAELDALLTPCSSRPLHAIDASTLATLRLAMYQLRHLDRIPQHAIVHGAVDAAKTLDGDRAGGFVNAVLRSYLRHQGTLKLPGAPAPGATRRQQLDYLNITCSHPRWLVARWLDRYGFEGTLAWCDYNNRPPEVSVRALTPELDAVAWLAQHGISAARSPVAPEFARLLPGQLGSLPEEVRSGLAVQDEGSALVAHAAGATPGERVLDLCAAPGGKSVVIWRDMQHQGLLVSSDLRAARLVLLRQTLRAAGAPSRVVGLDGCGPLPFDAGFFDRVLVDAPCSGLGTLRRDPDAKWLITLDDLPRLAAIQRALLAQAATVVRPGGLLVYATCSSEPEENEGVLEAFLREAGEFALEPWVGAGAADDGLLRTTPISTGSDAFFAARLRRQHGA